MEEVDISYIYPAKPVPDTPGVTRSFTVDGKTYNYKAEAANQTPEDVRIENVTDFWKYVGNKYLGTDYHINPNKLERFEKDDLLNNLTFKPRKRWNRR